MVTESEMERRAELQAFRNDMYLASAGGTLIDMVRGMRTQIYNVRLFEKVMPELGEAMESCEKSVNDLLDAVYEHIHGIEHEIWRRRHALDDKWSDEGGEIGKIRSEELERIMSIAYLEGRFMFMRASWIGDAEGMLRDMPYAHPNYLSKEEREWLKDVCKRLKGIADGTMDRGEETWGELDKALYRISLDDPREEETCQAEH